MKKDDLKKKAEKYGKVSEPPSMSHNPPLIIEGDGWQVEAIVEDGWTYLHGRGALHGTSTNIESTKELDAGIKRLKTAAGIK